MMDRWSKFLGTSGRGAKKKSKKRKTYPWVSDEGSEESSSSAEKQFKELDKQELMENQKRRWAMNTSTCWQI